MSIVLFPPLGLVLWWMRRGVGAMARVAGTLGICVVAIVELFAVYGMRLEWNGALKVSGVSFETRAQRDARLEASRARQRAAPPASGVAPVATARAVSTAAPVPSAPTPKIEHAAPPYWTDFRGPNRAGVYAETEIETDWPAAGLQRLW